MPSPSAALNSVAGTPAGLRRQPRSRSRSWFLPTRPAPARLSALRQSTASDVVASSFGSEAAAEPAVTIRMSAQIRIIRCLSAPLTLGPAFAFLVGLVVRRLLYGGPARVTVGTD